jgi:hypothetical protein
MSNEPIDIALRVAFTIAGAVWYVNATGGGGPRF